MFMIQKGTVFATVARGPDEEDQPPAAAVTAAAATAATAAAATATDTATDTTNVHLGIEEKHSKRMRASQLSMTDGVALHRGSLTDDSPIKDSIVTAKMGAGEVFGELAILSGQRRGATCTAMVDTKLLVLLGVDLEDVMAQGSSGGGFSSLASKTNKNIQLKYSSKIDAVTLMRYAHDVKVCIDAANDQGRFFFFCISFCISFCIFF